MTARPTLCDGEVRVVWLQGGLLVQVGADALLLDAPPGTVERLLPSELTAIRAVWITSGRMSALGGLLPLLHGVDEARGRRSDLPLPVTVPYGEERAGLVVEAWTRGWPDALSVCVDHTLPGESVNAGPLVVQTVGLRAAEPDRDRGVRGLTAVAVRVHTPAGVIAWVPSSAPSAAQRRACQDARLAVVTVGVVPWPRIDGRVRLTYAEAVALSDDAGDLWVVGDDGRFAPIEGEA